MDASIGVILVAAGQGSRLGAGLPKAFVDLAGQPLLWHAARAAAAARGVRAIVAVVPADRIDQSHALVRDAIEHAVDPAGDSAAATAEESATQRSAPRVDSLVVVGGFERSDSVAAGLAALPHQVRYVLVHDAARALAPTLLFERVSAALQAGAAAVVPGLPVPDTIKQVRVPRLPRHDGSPPLPTVSHTPERSSLRAIQTPQGFERGVLEGVHAQRPVGSAVTDDAAMVEAAGITVRVVAGEAAAHKITIDSDLRAARERLGAPDPGQHDQQRAVAVASDRSHDAGGPVLIALGGRPGVGKTTVARQLARRHGWTHLRLDTVEQALLRADPQVSAMAGYAILYALAADLLRAGQTVIADTVAPVSQVWQAWQRTAADTGSTLIEVELRCTDPEVHRHRVESRRPDIAGHALPDWSAATSPAYQEPEPSPDRLVIDTAAWDPEQVAEQVLVEVRRRTSAASGTPQSPSREQERA